MMEAAPTCLHCVYSKIFTLFYLYELEVITCIPSQFTAAEWAPIPTGWGGGWICPTVGLNAVTNRNISACTRKLTLYFLSTHSCIHIPAAMFSDSYFIMIPTDNKVIQHLNELCLHTQMHVKNTPRNSFYKFTQQGNLLHFKGMLHNPCCIFHKMPFI